MLKDLLQRTNIGLSFINLKDAYLKQRQQRGIASNLSKHVLGTCSGHNTIQEGQKVPVLSFERAGPLPYQLGLWIIFHSLCYTSMLTKLCFPNDSNVFSLWFHSPTILLLTQNLRRMHQVKMLWHFDAYFAEVQLPAT